jgi:hypothetical protein
MNFDFQLIYFWKFVYKGYEIDILSIHFKICLKKLRTIKNFYQIDY